MRITSRIPSMIDPSETEPRHALTEGRALDHGNGDDADQGGPASLGCIDIHERPTFVP